MVNYSFSRCAISISVLLFVSLTQLCNAQDFERYRPLTLPRSPNPQRLQPKDPAPAEGSDRILVDSLDAILILDSKEKLRPNDSMAEMVGLNHNFDSASSLVFRQGFDSIVNQYLGSPISLRRLNQLSNDLIKYYHRCGQPVVDVLIPEQRITGGTVQLIVIESRVGKMKVEGGCYFDPCDLTRWVGCTHSGNRIHQSAIANDLFWLNQNSFRQVDVDLRPGDAEDTTDVVFKINDVRPVNAYLGYEDTGVRSLMLERLYGGVIWGNAFGRDATLSYQYTADADFRSLHAHAVSYSEPLNRDWSWQTYGSWAGVEPSLPSGLSQEGESWQAGIGLTRHLVKNRRVDASLSMGFDFKATNNNLEFGGVNVQDSEADLAQLRAGYRRVERLACQQYSIFSVDAFIGPGGGFSSSANTAAMNTIRAGTTPDYMYVRARYERLWNMPQGWDFVARAKGQLSSERLMFSETLGFGGYDSIRGYDQRVLSGDSGWILNLELGPDPLRWGCECRKQTLRVYGLVDAGGAYIKDPIAPEVDEQILVSAGVGMRWTLSDRTNLRVDYAHGFEDVVGAASRDRIHIGLVTLFGPRP